MKYREYMEKYGIGFIHNAYQHGEVSVKGLEELLQTLKEEMIKCPDTVQGLIPVWVTIDPESAVDDIEEALRSDNYAGENYKMTEEGKKFLEKCFEEYNVKYSTHGNDHVVFTVEVPEDMKYELEE